MAGKSDLTIVQDAYLELLGLSHMMMRTRLQPVLAALRDEIASASGQEPEFIQNCYENYRREKQKVDDIWDMALGQKN